MKIPHPIILFDGVCNLCNNTIDFIIKHDRKKWFRFASLQSETGERLKHKFHIPPETDSIVFVHNSTFYIESEAALEIARLLPYPWKLARVFKIVPRTLRDKVYRWIARNRYRWFGKRETCRLPTPKEKESFID